MKNDPSLNFFCRILIIFLYTSLKIFNLRFIKLLIVFSSDFLKLSFNLYSNMDIWDIVGI